MSVLIVLALVAGTLHLIWESLHIRLYTGYEKMEGRLPVFVYATLGDILYTFLAIGLIALFKGSLIWFLAAQASDYLGLAIMGFFIALSVEYKAMALKRWEYTEKMPRFLGLGLTPLLQMTVLLPLSVSSTVEIARTML